MTWEAHRWHDAIVESVVGSYPECVYIEIGVASCVCFNKAARSARIAHAVDPDRNAISNVARVARDLTRGWNMTSDRFFKTFVGEADVIFIDGKHTYEQAKRDFENAAVVLRPGGAILLHDVWPDSVADTRPQACGDVYRLADEILRSETLDDWRSFQFGRFPGLLLCQRAEDNEPWQP